MMPDVTSATELRTRLDDAPMSRTQIRAVAITFMLSALDGYDVLSATFAAPAISADWGIGKAALGIVLSAGLAGMALGALLLAPLADSVGRKAMILVSLVLMAIGMLGCAMSPSIEWLASWRVITGLGIGACVAVINPVAAEFANARRRPLTVAIMAVGFPAGGVIGGVVAALLLRQFGWEAVFTLGSVAAAVLIPVIMFALPESLGYLLARERRDGLSRVNAVLVRYGQPTVAALAYPSVSRVGYAAIFSPRIGTVTAWITLVNVLFVLTVYYVLSWLPQLVADAGFEPSVASLVSVAASSAGVVGGLALGFLAQRGRLRELVASGLLGLAAATALFGAMPPSLPLLFLAASLCGFFLFGGAAGMYATLATTFPDEARAAGTGFVSGMGRISSACAPALAGWLFAAGLTRAEVSIAFAACSTAAGLLLLWGWRKVRVA